MTWNPEVGGVQDWLSPSDPVPEFFICSAILTAVLRLCFHDRELASDSNRVTPSQGQKEKPVPCKDEISPFLLSGWVSIGHVLIPVPVTLRSSAKLRLNQELANCVCKNQAVKNLGFVEYMVSVTTIELCKSSHRQYVNEHGHIPINLYLCTWNVQNRQLYAHGQWISGRLGFEGMGDA